MEEVSVLIGKSQSGDKEAREVLIEKNLGLVHHIVKRFLGRGYDPEDLFQIGVIGLMKAIELSEEAQLDREDVILAMEAGAEVESLYSSSGQEDGSELCLADRVVAAAHGCVGASMGSSGAVENDVEKDRLLDQMLLAQLLGELPERDRELIRMRYFQNKTQTEIAGILGISQVQVSRLEKKILREMREMAG